jgi:hypothetical protein
LKSKGVSQDLCLAFDLFISIKIDRTCKITIAAGNPILTYSLVDFKDLYDFLRANRNVILYKMLIWQEKILNKTKETDPKSHQKLLDSIEENKQTSNPKNTKQGPETRPHLTEDKYPGIAEYIPTEEEQENNKVSRVQKRLVKLSQEKDWSNPGYCLEAVKKDGFNLEHVKNQTEEICLAAVEDKPLALKYVKNQTPKICTVAISQSFYALKYVKDKTLEICKAAVNRNINAMQFVPEEMREQVLGEISLKEKLKQYLKITMFKHLGEGFDANAYQVNDSQIVRISQDIPPPLPKDPYINQREGFIKIGLNYIEIFPLLKDIGTIPEEELMPIQKYLEEKYRANDLHENNFGRDLQTGQIKLLDPGCLSGNGFSKEDLTLIGSTKVSRLIKKTIL